MLKIQGRFLKLGNQNFACKTRLLASKLVVYVKRNQLSSRLAPQKPTLAGLDQVGRFNLIFQ